MRGAAISTIAKHVPDPPQSRAPTFAGASLSLTVVTDTISNFIPSLSGMATLGAVASLTINLCPLDRVAFFAITPPL